MDPTPLNPVPATTATRKYPLQPGPGAFRNREAGGRLPPRVLALLALVLSALACACIQPAGALPTPAARHYDTRTVVPTRLALPSNMPLLPHNIHRRSENSAGAPSTAAIPTNTNTTSPAVNSTTSIPTATTANNNNNTTTTTNTAASASAATATATTTPSSTTPSATTTMTLATGENETTNGTLTPVGSGTDKVPWYEANIYYIAGGGGGFLLLVIITAVVLIRCGCCSCCGCRCGKATAAVHNPSATPSSAQKRSDRKRGVHVDNGFAFDREGEQLEMHNLVRGHRRSGVTTMDAYAPAHAHGYKHPPAAREELQGVLGKHAQTFKSAQLTILESLGSGQYTHTHRGLLDKHANHTDPEAVDVKTPLNDAGTIKLLQEAAIAAQFSHRKVLRLVGLVLDRREGMAVMYEHMEKGPLDRVLRRSSVSLAEKVSMMSDVAQGLHYLACCNFVVGDLMAQHVMVGPDYVCKIGGFGMSRDASDTTNTASDLRYRWAAQELLPPPHLVATVSWRKSGDSGLEALTASFAPAGAAAAGGGGGGGGATATSDGPPQQHVPGCYTTASDVWAFGVVMWEVLSDGDLPYGHLSDSKIVTSVLAGERLPPPAQCPVDLYRLMMACWHPSSRHRPALDDIVSRLAHERTVVAAHTVAPSMGSGAGTHKSSSSSVVTATTVATAIDAGDSSVSVGAGAKKTATGDAAVATASSKQTKDTLHRIQTMYLRLSPSPPPQPSSSAANALSPRDTRRSPYQQSTAITAPTCSSTTPVGVVTMTTAAATATAGSGGAVPTSRRGSDELATRSAATSGIESMTVSDETRAARALGASKTAPRRLHASPAVPSPLAPSAAEPTFVRVFNGNTGASGGSDSTAKHPQQQQQQQEEETGTGQRASQRQQWAGPPVVVEGEDSYLTILPHEADVSKTFPRMRPPVQPHNQQQQQQQQQQSQAGRARDGNGDTHSHHDVETYQTKLEDQSKAVSSPTLASTGFHLPVPATAATATPSSSPRRQRPVSDTAARSGHGLGASSDHRRSGSPPVSGWSGRRRRYNSDTTASRAAATSGGVVDVDDSEAATGDGAGSADDGSGSSGTGAPGSPGKTALAVALEGVKKEPGEATIITPPRPKSEHFPAAGPRPHLPPLVPYQRVPVPHASPTRPTLSRQASLEADSDGDGMGAVQAALEEAIAAGESYHRQQALAHGQDDRHHLHQQPLLLINEQQQQQQQQQQEVSGMKPCPLSPEASSRRSSGGSAVAFRPPVVAGEPQEKQERHRRLMQMFERGGDGAEAVTNTPFRGARGSPSAQRLRRDHVVADTPVLPATRQQQQHQKHSRLTQQHPQLSRVHAASAVTAGTPRDKNAEAPQDDMALMSEAERAPPGQELAMMDRVHKRFPLVAQGSVESSDSAPSRATHTSLSAVDTIRSSPFSSRGSTERGRAFPILSRGASLDASHGGRARTSSSPRRLSPTTRLGAGSPQRTVTTAAATVGDESGRLLSASSTSEGGSRSGTTPTDEGTTGSGTTASGSSGTRTSLLSRGRGTVFSRLRQLAAPWSTRGGGEFVPEPDATASVVEAWANPVLSSSPASNRSSVLLPHRNNRREEQQQQQQQQRQQLSRSPRHAATAAVEPRDGDDVRRRAGLEGNDDGADEAAVCAEETNHQRTGTDAASREGSASTTTTTTGGERGASALEMGQAHQPREEESDACARAVAARPSSPPPGVLPGAMPPPGYNDI